MPTYSIRARLGLLGLALGAALLALWLAGYGLAGAATAVAGVVVAPSKAAQSAAPGVTVTYTLQITNTGSITDTFDVIAAGYHWPTNILGTGSGGTILLPLNGHGSVEVEVTVPLTGTGHDVANITVTSQNDSNVSATATLTTAALFKLYLPLVMR